MMPQTMSVYLRPDDSVVFRTLTEALYELLQDMTIDEMSISMLVQKAGVGRASFYRYFKDKYDLVNAIHLRMIENTLYTYFDGQSLDKAVSSTLQVFKDNKRYYKNALTSSDVNSLGNYIFSNTYGFYERVLKENGIIIDKHRQQILRMYCFGSVALLTEWVVGNMDESLDVRMKASVIGLPDFVREVLK